MRVNLELWHVELHSHSHWSKDSIVRPETIRRILDQQKIARIAITDHNTIEGALEFQRLAPDRVIVGEEIMTTQGELLGYFMKETIPYGLTPQATIERLRDQGAVISVSHPFDRLRKGAWEEINLMRIIDQVDAIEVFNARCLFPEDNVKAARFAAHHNLHGTVGSDAHSREEYGRAVQVMTPFEDAQGFIASLNVAQAKQRYSGWWVHAHSMTAKWSRKLGLRSRLWEGG